MKKLLILAFLLSGCLGNYSKLTDTDKRVFQIYSPIMSPSQRGHYLNLETDAERDAYAKELGLYQRLHAFDDKTYQAILDKLVILGMPEDAVFLSWGPPTSEHRSISQQGEIKEWSYRKIMCKGNLYNEAEGKLLADVPFNNCTKFNKTITFGDGKAINLFE